MDFIKYLAEKYNMTLNEQQQKAVLHVDSPMLLIASPGSGKTTTTICRNANLVINHHIDPSSILTLTFSKAAARDMAERFNSLFGKDIPEGMMYSTIHSFCRSVIVKYCKKFNKEFPQVIEGSDENNENEERKILLNNSNTKDCRITKIGILKQIYYAINKEYITEDKLDNLLNAISYLKNAMIEPEKINSKELEIKNFVDIYNEYEKYKKARKLIDFDDMLVHALTILKKDRELLQFYRERYKYINVDESQDSSKIQNEVIKLLANPRNNIFMVGDLDQSIYMFRGAEPKLLLDFEKNYPGAQICYMEQNFRTIKSIVNLANKFIKQNLERFDKDMFTTKEEGVAVKSSIFTERQEQYTYLLDIAKSMNVLSDIAVLYRNNYSSIPLVDLLDRNNIPFYVRDFKTNLFKHQITQDIVTFLEFALDTTNISLFEKIYFKMNAFISKAAIDFVKANWQPGKHVIDILSTYPDILHRSKSNLREIKTAFNLIAQSSGKRIIEHIENSLNYSDYLKNKAKESGSKSNNSYIILSTLKSICSGTANVKDFLYRLGSLELAIKNAKKNKGKNAVTLTTIHSSKGLEFKKVFMIDLIDEQFPSLESIEELKEGNRSLFEEEVRLFYVGATRAMEYLELMTACYSDGSIIKPSRFIGSFLDNKDNTQKSLGTANDKSDLYKNFCEANEIGIGSKVWHIKYGHGTMESVEGNIVEIRFSRHGVRKMALDICIKGNLLKVVNE